MESETAPLLLGIIFYVLSTVVGGYTFGCVSQPSWNRPRAFQEHGLLIPLSHWGLLIISFFLIGVNGSWTIAIILALLKIFVLDRFAMYILKEIGLF